MNERQRRLALRIVIGVAAGLAYAYLNEFVDRKMSEPGAGPFYRYADEVFDVAVPVLVAVAVSVYLFFIDANLRLAKSETVRAQQLEGQLRHTERDQAAWLVAASTLHRLLNPMHSLGLALGEVPDGSAVVRARQVLAEMVESVGELRAMQGAQRQPAIVRVDVAALLANVLLVFTPLLGRINIALRPARTIAIADREYLRVVLEIVLKNAIDAVPKDGTGRIGIACEARGENLSVAIEDNGPGISREQRTHLFEPLAGSTKTEGLGMGLAIARALLRAMQGELVCEEAARGARFVLNVKAAA